MLEIVYLPVNALKPYEKNARKHGDPDVDAIAASIREFGFNDPVGVWGENNLIVEGHGRLLAAQKLGMTEVPCIRLDELSDEQRRAYALTHNKTAENSEWNDDLLFGELSNIFDIDMEQFGFGLEDDDDKTAERKEVDFVEAVSVVIDCENEEKAEEIFEKLQNEGYKCRISTL